MTASPRHTRTLSGLGQGHVVTGTRDMFAGQLTTDPARLAIAVSVGLVVLLAGGGARRFSASLR